MSSKQKILFVGLRYHNYTQAIIDEIKLTGCDVTYVDIQPRSFLFKIFKTLNNRFYAQFLGTHHRRAIEQAALCQYDQVVFLQVHQMTFDNLSMLRKTQPKARFTLYNWDSISNHDYLSRIKFFDRVLTFDHEDAKKHGFEYLPLFCIRPIQALHRDLARARSIFMVGNIVNINRYKTVQHFAEYCNRLGIHFDTYLAVSPVVWWRLRQLGIRPKGLHFRPISQQAFARMTEEALAVFDFANHQQSGYTMRTIENLCAGKKIITNNQNCLNDWFYSPDRIHCYQDLDFSGVEAFLEQPIKVVDQRFEVFHIQEFTKRLLGIANSPGLG
jgi:hypothetical protein